MNQILIVETTVEASLEKSWKYWTEPIHIINWTFASDDWCCPNATSDFKIGGKFSTRMEAKDKTNGFDFEGYFSEIITHKKIAYIMLDNRVANIEFIQDGGQTKIIEAFEAENENSLELQKNGWQAILTNFKKYVESK